MNNSMMVIAPYWLKETKMWVFDDEAVGLRQEPFVCGIPEMIDDLVSHIPAAREGFRMIFSAKDFPGSQRKLTWLRSEHGGNWYLADRPAIEGWLCPALFKYFDEAPATIFVKADSL